MDDSEKILAELQKISAAARAQRALMSAVLAVLLCFVATLLYFAYSTDQQMKKAVAESVKPVDFDAEVTWHNVDGHISKGDVQTALRMGNELIKKTPDFPDGHARLANAYLAAGDLAEAKAHLLEAFRLLPSEKNRELLDAVNKRIGQEKSPPRP